MTKEQAKIDYESAVKFARTACGSRRSLNCVHCKRIIVAWKVYEKLLLRSTK